VAGRRVPPGTGDLSVIVETESWYAISAPMSPSEGRPRGDDTFPSWAALRNIGYTPNQYRGHGVEPHFHDCDEFWFFTSGVGEAWLDGVRADVSPNTMVYTPAGVVHRFQMFTDYATVGIQGRREGLRRSGHLLVAEHGTPTPTAEPVVVPGTQNVGPFGLHHSRLPVHEMRLVAMTGGQEVMLTAESIEYWIPIAGSIDVTLDDLVRMELAASPSGTSRSTADLIILRPGVRAVRRAPADAIFVLVRE
jgi:mannose-6-phosphate isomerase-like protein (cupin superfamily)